MLGGGIDPLIAGVPVHRGDVAPSFCPAGIGVLAFDVTLLGADGGGPRSGAVCVAKRSGPPVRSVISGGGGQKKRGFLRP